MHEDNPQEIDDNGAERLSAIEERLSAIEADAKPERKRKQRRSEVRVALRLGLVLMLLVVGGSAGWWARGELFNDEPVSEVVELDTAVAGSVEADAAPDGDDAAAGDDGDDMADYGNDAAPDGDDAAAGDDGDDMADYGDDEDEATGLPGEGVSVTMARANWSSGYFQAQVFKQVMEELGYEVSEPSERELGPSLAYLAMAQGDIDFWANSWYPGHRSWLATELPDGSTVGEHVSPVGELMPAGGLQGYLVTKSVADEYGITHLDQLNDDPAITALFDTDGDGVAEIYG